MIHFAATDISGVRPHI